MDQAIDLVEAVESLTGRGYVREFRIKDGQLYDLSTGTNVDTGAIHVDVALGFASGPDSADASNLYAISVGHGDRKGLLIDAFDTLDRECASELFERLTAGREPVSEADSATRYGLRKVFKSAFDQDPGRYVLRIGFPDFPACPFGQSFSILGFDTADQEYVWLVTSILRDARLARIPFQDVASDEE